MASTPWVWRVAAALLLGASSGVYAQVVVIVHPKSSIGTLSADQVASLYLGKTSSLPGGISQAVDLPESSPAREQFYSKATGKNPAQVKAIWARLAFSGKAKPPKELASAAEVKKWVAAQPDAIAYIEKSAADDSVKTVLTVD
jgi:ABC-type phosphate transport system substrate-binding protein